MAIVKIKSKTYSDVAYVFGTFNRRDDVVSALYNHCKCYFNQNYRAVFFIGDEYKDEIFHESFLKLWENIERRKIYVEDNVLKGKGGEPFTGQLTTYFMSIARLKYLEWARDRRKRLSSDEYENVWNTADLASYTELLYDDGDSAMLEVVSNCISKMPKRCNQILTMFYYEEKTLDEIMAEMPELESKNALKTRKYKCMEELRKTAKAICRRMV